MASQAAASHSFPVNLFEGCLAGCRASELGPTCVSDVITYVTAFPSRQAVRRNVVILQQSNRRCPTSEKLAQLVAPSNDIATIVFFFFFFLCWNQHHTYDSREAVTSSHTLFEAAHRFAFRFDHIAQLVIKILGRVSEQNEPRCLLQDC